MPNLIIASISFTLAALCYLFLKRGLTSFKTNRILLLLIPALSMLLPFVDFTSIESVAFVQALKPVNIKATSPTMHAVNYDYLKWFYLVGFAVSLLIGIYHFVKFHLLRIQLIRASILYAPGVYVQSKYSSFTLGRTIFLHQDDSNQQWILAHEKSHVTNLHYVDLIIYQFFKIVYWFNPLIYLLERELKSNHEYQADQHVIRAGCTRKDYLNILLNRHFEVANFQFIQSFDNKSSLKKRVENIQKKTKNITMKYLIIIPALLVVFATTAFVNQPYSHDPPKELYDVDVPASYPGGFEALAQFLSEHLVFPKEHLGKSQVVVVQCTIETDGSVVNPTVLNTNDIEQAFIDEALRVCELIPNWKPGMKDNQPVRTKFRLPIRFESPQD